MKRGRMAGFTLLEVVVAFSILAIAVTTLLVAFGTAMRRVSMASDYQRALFAAESQMAYMQGIMIDQLQVGVSEGVTEQGIYWRSEISEYGDVERKTNIPVFMIVVTTGWGGNQHRDAVSLATLRMGAP